MLGLPLPLPQSLQRASGPDPALPLADLRAVVVGVDVGGGGGLGELAAAAARSAGCTVEREAATGAATASVGAHGTPLHALLVDAGEVSSVADLRVLYDALHGRIAALNRCGRVIVLGRPPAGSREPARAAARAGLEGFVRALGKEIGRRGATANLLRIEDDAETRLAGPLCFLLSRRSAFVSGQALHIGHLARAEATQLQERPLQGQTALVTGAARGIGEAIARRLAEEGARVLLVDLPSSAAELSAVAAAVGGEALHCDLAAEGGVEALMADLQGRGQRVHILVHNAGITRDRTLAKMSPAHWDLCLAVNLQAAVRGTELALSTGVLRPSGRVLCLSSIGGIGGNPGQTNYATAKRALMGYVEALSHRLGREGGAAMAIAPGFIETQMTAAMPPLLRQAGRRLNSLGQGGLPEDVADAVAFLATPSAIGLAGQTLRVCGQHLAGA